VRAVRVHGTGGPEVMAVAEVAEPTAGPGQIVVDVVAAGVNFSDAFVRDGRKVVPLPTGIGVEGAGTVVEVGEGVESLAVGDPIAWDGVLGSYAERLAVDLDRVVPIPDGVSPVDAATVLHQGITAQYLATDTYPLGPGDTAVVYGAAGGVGSLLVQLAKRRGARVIGCVSTEAKVEFVEAIGADAVVRYTEQDVVAAIGALTDGRGADVVYDAIGAATFDRSLEALRPRGTLVLCGESSGRVPPLDLGRLGPKGLYVTRPTLAAYVSSRDELLARGGEVLEHVRDGRLRPHVHQRYRLEEATQAHIDLASGTTQGKLLIVPSEAAG
jgi:NADPH:quinone reductase